MLCCLLIWTIFIFLFGQSSVLGAAIKSSQAVETKPEEKESFKVSVQSDNNATCVQFNESQILQKAFGDYDDSVPPGLNGQPVKVRPQITVMSVPLFDEANFLLGLKLEVVQEWVDWRLDLGLPVVVVLPAAYVPRIWMPQLMFENSNSELSKHLSLYMSIAIHPGGRIIQTTHASVSVHCKFFYQEYPFDQRVCEVKFGSFTYDTSKVMYEWPDQNSFPLSFWEGALEPLTEFEFQQFQLFRGVMVSYKGMKYSRLGFRLLASRKSSLVIKSYVIPVGLLVPLSWAPTFISDNNVAARIIAGSTILGITWAAVSVRPRGTTLPVGYDSLMEYFCYAIFLQVASSLFQSTAMIILKKRENPVRREEHVRQRALRRQRRQAGREGCMGSIGRAIMDYLPYFSRQMVQEAVADDVDQEAGEVLGEDDPTAAQPSKWLSSSMCNSLFHILAPITFILVLVAFGLQVVIYHNRRPGIWTPLIFVKIKEADRFIFENL